MSIQSPIALLLTCAAVWWAPVESFAAAKAPSILVIWSDDIGWQNISAYDIGTIGYTTPSIERIGTEGIRFTARYAQPSHTAGPTVFIAGQDPIRSGMTTVP